MAINTVQGKKLLVRSTLDGPIRKRVVGGFGHRLAGSFIVLSQLKPSKVMSQTSVGDKISAVKTYFDEISGKLKTGQAREHSYRPAFEHLIKRLDEKLAVVNEPKRSEHGAPDFIFLRGPLTIGYAETKDIDVDLDKVERTEQLERYLGYSNLILTNCLEFRFFRNGERYCEPIVVGELVGDSVIDNDGRFGLLAETLSDFLKGKPEQIRSGARLARIMGGKARRIRDNVIRFLTDGAEKNQSLWQVYETVKKLLVHDLTTTAFADMYAQTLVYGLFVARFHDTSQESFTRQEARDLVPASNPFLRHFFDHIVGPDFDKRLAYIVGELCDIFANVNVKELMNEYFKKSDLWGKTHQGPDPVIHFYEDFLKEYDAEQRKKLGAFYTPLPVVHFIIRAIDSILEKDFDLAQGLADTSKIDISQIVQGKKVKESMHRVQILDPATGTGTFLNETVRAIHARFTGQTGRWMSYVDENLLPRLYGFELMMAPYTIAHMKLGMTLADTGYTSFNHRLGIYLTNSLEEAHNTDGTLFSLGLSQSIAEEAVKASQIKSEKPIMVVLGNPPYSVSSSNKGEWIQDLIKVYKDGLGERKINLDDDYIKFIRFAEHFIEKNGSGIVAMITNNSFIDGITHRAMRKHLLDTFDTIYILDLHGNSKKKEKAPDGGKDENVFDIQQGVSISIFAKKEGKKKVGLADVYHFELWGKREDKFAALNASTIENVKWNKLNYSEPYYFFVPKDFGDEEEYKKGFSVTEIFGEYNSGIQTKRDDLTISFDRGSIEAVATDMENLPVDEIRKKYNLPEDGRDWKIEWAKKDVTAGYKIENIQYRPFDTRYTLYTGRSKGFLAYPREKTNKNIVGKDNLSLLTSRMIPPSQDFDRSLVTRNISDIHAASDQTYVFPLYLYADDGSKVSNLKKEIVEKIKNIVGDISPEDIFDYIYAMSYSPTYRQKYKEFLRIDFPRIPYPKDAQQFKSLVSRGRELRNLHLFESKNINILTTYPASGSNTVEAVSYKNGNVFINIDQYFGNVPATVWDFHIGGYIPAQKWLKDRRGHKLSDDEISHYQKIIVAISETARIMEEIGKII